MRAAIQKRISRRAYQPMPLSGKTIEGILSHIEQLSSESGLMIEFIEDATAAFVEVVEKSGLFVGARSIILLKGKIDLPHLYETAGYYGEELILRLTEMELGTCWLNSTFDRTVFPLAPDEKLVCAVSVGYVGEMTERETKVRDRLMKVNKPLDERIAYEGQLPDWIVEGMSAVMLAPSSKNTQKVCFQYNGGVVTATVPDDFAMDLVDLGIAKRHFEIEANGRFAFGNGAAFSK